MYESPNKDNLAPQKKKKNQNEPSLAVWEAGSSRATKCSVDLLSGTELGNFMESYVLYLFWMQKRSPFQQQSSPELYC